MLKPQLISMEFSGMRTRWSILLGLALLASMVFGAFTASAQNFEFLEAKPLAQRIKTVPYTPYTAKLWKMPTITWCGDGGSGYADREDYFNKAGLQVELFNQNVLAEQVLCLLKGECVAIRGEMGMVVAAADALSTVGVELVVAVQLTWSNGGDALVVLENIESASDLKGTEIPINLDGPHQFYTPYVLSLRGVKPSDVTYQWFRELTIPAYDTKGLIVDPFTAFAKGNAKGKKRFAAVPVVRPDAKTLTGSGDFSVSGSRILTATDSNARIISDVIAFPKPWFDANRDQIFTFVRTLLQGQEGYQNLLANREKNAAVFQQVLQHNATLLLGTPRAATDFEASFLPPNCVFVGPDGNQAFFTGEGTTRTMTALVNEIVPLFQEMNLISGPVKLHGPNWDWAKLSEGLKPSGIVSAAKEPTVDTAALEASVAKRTAKANSAELDQWEEEGTLFTSEIFFGPRQTEFPVAEYADDYEVALKIYDANPGAFVFIEPHASPYGINRAIQRKDHPAVIAEMKRDADETSDGRGDNVRNEFFAHAKKRGIVIDKSRVAVTSMSIKAPKYPKPRTKQEWAENRRVVIRIKSKDAFKAEELEFQAPKQ